MWESAQNNTVNNMNRTGETFMESKQGMLNGKFKRFGIEDEEM